MSNKYTEESISVKLTKANLQEIKKNALDGYQYKSDVEEAKEGIKLFINSKVLESEKLLRSKSTCSMLHCHGNGVLAMLKALMTVNFLTLVLTIFR